MLNSSSLRRSPLNGDRSTSSLFGRHWLLAQCVLLLALLATFVLATVQVHRYEDGVTRTSFTLPGSPPSSPPTPVLRFAPKQTSLDVVAVIAHGYAANKELMSAFGVDLAKQG